MPFDTLPDRVILENRKKCLQISAIGRVSVSPAGRDILLKMGYFIFHFLWYSFSEIFVIQELLRYPIFPRNYMNHFKHYRFSYSYSVMLFLFIPNGTRLCLHYTGSRRLLFSLSHSECNKGNRRRLHAGKIAFASAQKPRRIFIIWRRVFYWELNHS